MKAFKDLVHNEHLVWDGGTQAKLFFDNGYGVSVVRHENSYGGDIGLYELAVVQGTEDDFYITYNTDVTSDVEGYLNEAAVTRLMKLVQAL